MTSARRWSLVGLSVVAVLVADQLSKWWAVERLRGRAPIEIVWTLQFQYAENTGMAFSRGEGWGRFIGLFALVIVAVLLFAARRMTSTYQLVLVGVVVGGALGNITDRIFRAQDGALSGAVVDFIDVQWWPIFNVADACVVVGGILLALSSLREPVPEPGPEPGPDADAGMDPDRGRDPLPSPSSDASSDAASGPDVDRVPDRAGSGESDQG